MPISRIGTDGIEAGAVATDDLADGAVTSAKMATAVQPIGVGQTWQNVIGSRAKRTTYQNTTGRPIVVAVSFVNPFASTLQLWTHSASADILSAGVMVIQGDGGDYYSSTQYTNHPANVTAIIVPNYYYQLYDPNNDVTIQYWTELR